jgi:hypothetical protein
MKIFFKSLGLGAVIVVGCLLLAIYIAGTGRLGNFDPVTKPTGPAVDHAIIQQRQQLPASTLTLGDKANTEILFGDLHVHTTYSFDAFTLSLPTTNGNVGSHPPADACDFARYCSALDFWSINDHAEQITPRIWSETIDAIRACNDLAIKLLCYAIWATIPFQSDRSRPPYKVCQYRAQWCVALWLCSPTTSAPAT